MIVFGFCGLVVIKLYRILWRVRMYLFNFFRILYRDIYIDLFIVGFYYLCWINIFIVLGKRKRLGVNGNCIYLSWYRFFLGFVFGIGNWEIKFKREEKDKLFCYLEILGDR